MAVAARNEFIQYIESAQLIGTNGSPTQFRQPFTTAKHVADFWSKTRIKQAFTLSECNNYDIGTIREHFRRVFSILVRIDRADYIKELLPHVRFRDQYLPFHFSDPHSRAPPPHWPLRPEDFQLFYEKQWQFCVPTLDESLMSGPKFDENTILPFEKMGPLGAGGTATTSKIRIHEQCSRIPPLPGLRATQDFVLKTYHTHEAFKHYKNEVNVFRRLMRPNKSNNMITFYGCWEHGSTYNVLLEYADRGSLIDYFANIHPPTRFEDIMMFWDRIFGLVNALHEIHEMLDTRQGHSRIIQGIHQDVKPANILVCSGATDSDYDVYFKIADFGLSNFHAKPETGQKVRAKDNHGTQQYSAPEICRSPSSLQSMPMKVSPKIDVWSLGCVFSEAAVWAVLGEQGRKDYAQLRKREIPLELVNDGYGDCFHNGFKLLSAVTSMHERLRQEHRVSDHITENMIDRIEVMLGWTPSDRPNAAILIRLLSQTLQSAKRLADNAEFPKAFQTGRPPSIRQTQTFPGPSQSPGQMPAKIQALPHPLLDHGMNHVAPRPFLDLEEKTSHQYPPPLRSSRHALDTLAITNESKKSLGISQPPTSPHNVRSGEQIWGAMPPPLPNDSQPHHRNPRRRSTVSFQLDQPSETHGSRDPYYEYGPNKRESSYSHSSTIPISDPTHPRTRSDSVTVSDAMDWKKGQGSLIDVYLGRLEGRDCAFLIDDSESMRRYWQQVVWTFKGLVNIVKEADPDGVDLFFTNSNTRSPVKSRKWGQLVSTVATKRPVGRCNMKTALMDVIDKYITDNFEGPVGSSKFKRVIKRTLWNETRKRGLSVYILTDGVWQEGPGPVCGVEEPIRLIVKKLKETSKIDEKVGIQFILFGDDPKGSQRLDILDSRLQDYFPDIEMDIVDTTRYDGNVLKMLFGAFDRHWDGDHVSTFAHAPGHNSPSPSGNIHPRGSDD